MEDFGGYLLGLWGDGDFQFGEAFGEGVQGPSDAVGAAESGVQADGAVCVAGTIKILLHRTPAS